MSSSIRVLRRKRRQSNVGTGAAVIGVTATISFPPAIAGTEITWTVMLNASDAVASLPFTGPELARIQCVQFDPIPGWKNAPCELVTDLGNDPAGRSYALQFDNINFIAPTDPDVITMLLVPYDSPLFTSASGTPARGFINACPFISNSEAYLSCTHAASM